MKFTEFIVFFCLFVSMNVRENNDIEDSGREAYGGAAHGSSIGKIRFPRHRFGFLR